MAGAPIGIIGGSGLYQMEGVTITDEKWVETPYGRPSDAILLGTLAGKSVAFLPRHGRGHVYPPHQINYRANIYALKSLGVNRIISASAVGSMKEEIKPGHLVIIDQLVDRTKDRPQTFFADGITAHVAFSDPICPQLQKGLVTAARSTGATVHDGGAYVCIEGPMFSTRAESLVYRSWNVDVIGMTNYQEAKLAREAEICYATIALSTDYDCWHEGEEAVTQEMVITTMMKNVKKAQETIRAMLPSVDAGPVCSCNQSLKGAIVTDPKKITSDVKKRLSPIAGKYF